MAGNIQTRISLVGAEEVRRAFQRIGDEGKKAFNDIQQAAQATQLDTRLNTALSNVSVALQNLGQSAALVGLSVVNLAAATARAALPFAALGTAAGVAAAGVAAAFTAATKSAVSFYDTLNKGATAAGTTVQNLQSLQFAAVRAGGSAESLTAFMAKLQTELSGVQDQVAKTGFTVDKSGNRIFSVLSEETGNAATQIRVYTGETQKAATATSDLGKFLIDAGAAGKAPEEALLKIADAFKKLPEGAEKNRIALKLFGDSAADLIPILNLGSEGIRQYQAEGGRLKLFFSELEQKELAKAKIAFNTLGLELQLFKAKLGTLVAPVVTQALDALRAKFEQNQEAIRAFVRDGLETAKRVFLEFVAAFNGEAVQTPWIRETVATFRALGDIIRFVASVITGVLIPVFATVRDAFNGVAKDINSVFGTSISGAQLAIGVFAASTATAIGLVSAAFATLFTTGLLVVRSFQLIQAAGALMWATIGGGAATAATAVAAGFGVGGVAAVAIIAGFAAIGAAAVLYWDEIKAGASATWEFVKQQFSQGASGLSDLWTTLTSDANDAWAQIRSGATLLWDGIRAGAEGLADFVRGAFDSIVATVRNAFTGLVGLIEGAVSAAISSINSLIASIQAAAASVASLFSSSSSNGNSTGGGFASGGLIRGRGTGTSDSIIARVSNGEFIIRADAVKKFGTQFFAMLNAGRMPSGFLPKYATGGLVGGTIALRMPDMAGAMSSGQQATAAAPTRAVTVVIDGNSFGPMIAPENVAGALVDYATRTKMRRAGSKPSWER